MTTERDMILVVDDDDVFRDYVREVLERGGFRVRDLDDGARVLEVAAEEGASVLVLDVNLPGLNGYEICRRVRERLDPGIGIIFVSGFRTESFDRTAGLLLGADDYLSKPFDPSELVARVRRFSRRQEHTTNGGKLDALTPREHEILMLLADGESPNDIADQLVISPKTVST